MKTVPFLMLLVPLAAACSGAAPDVTPAPVITPVSSLPGGTPYVTLPPGVTLPPSEPDDSSPHPDDSAFDESTAGQAGLVAYEQLPHVDVDPITELRNDAAVFVYFDITFDQFVALQKQAFTNAGWEFTRDISLDGRWVFEARNGERRSAGGALDCTATFNADDGSPVEVCTGLPAKLLAGRTPAVQANFAQPR